ncbi:hypothetical protein ACWGOE_01575 [Leucobacter chromiiresistens]
MGAIDLTIPGQPSGIYDLADWLDANVVTSTEEIEASLRKTDGDSHEFWQGRTGDRFRANAETIAEGVKPIGEFAGEAAAVFHAYVRRLERGREEFAGYRDEAVASALIVAGDTIALPMPPKTYITAPGHATPIERGPGGVCLDPMSGEEYEAACRLFDEIGESVGTWWGELENWINEQIVPLMARATDFAPLTDYMDELQAATEFARSVPLALSAGAWEEQLRALESEAKSAQASADEFADRLRSGDPSVSGPLQRTSKAEVRAVADVLADRVGQLKVGTKIIIPGSGLVIDIVSASADVANGGSVSSAGVGLAAGIGGGYLGAGGVAVVAAAFGTTFPPTGVAIAVAAIASGIGRGATYLYEKHVPLDVREAIDAGDFEYVFA